MKIIALEKHIRIVEGELSKEIDIDWSAFSLTELKNILSVVVDDYRRSFKLLKKWNCEEELGFYQGGHHIDLIEHGKGSTNLLTVSDLDRECTLNGD